MVSAAETSSVAESTRHASLHQAVHGGEQRKGVAGQPEPQHAPGFVAHERETRIQLWKRFMHSGAKRAEDDQPKADCI